MRSQAFQENIYKIQGQEKQTEIMDCWFPLLCNYKSKIPVWQNWNFCKNLIFDPEVKSLCHSKHLVPVFLLHNGCPFRKQNYSRTPAPLFLGWYLIFHIHLNTLEFWWPYFLLAWDNPSICWCPGLVTTQIFLFWTVIYIFTITTTTTYML